MQWLWCVKYRHAALQRDALSEAGSVLALSRSARQHFGEEYDTVHCAYTSLPLAGRCGNGPNLVLEARGEAGSELALSHVSTPAKLAEALRAFTPLEVSEGLLKVSTGCVRWRLRFHTAETVVKRLLPASQAGRLARVLLRGNACLTHACLRSTSCWSALRGTRSAAGRRVAWEGIFSRRSASSRLHLDRTAPYSPCTACNQCQKCHRHA